MAGDATNESVLEALSGWCEDKMRAIAVGTEPLTDQGNSWHIEALNENYATFREELLEEQGIRLAEEGPPQDDWVLIGEDFLRVYHMATPFKDEDGNHTLGFNRKKHSKEFMGKLHSSTNELFQEWIFSLSWDMAKMLLEHKMSDESSSDSDEEEEEGEEEDSSEEEEESESSEGSGGSDSDSDSNGDVHTTNGTNPASKKQKTDKE